MSKRELREELEGSADHPRQIDSRIDMIQNAATEVPSVNGEATTSKERSTMDTGHADTTRPVMEGTEEFIKPIVKDGEIILEVECGQNKALLYLSKLCQGSKGPCIFYQGSWLTPNEFQFVSGRETAKDWKRSIRHHGKSLKLLLAKGILTVHPTVCECEGCRHSSTTPTRCRNGEKRSRVSTSSTDVKGKGTSSPVEHHVNGAFKPVQHVRPQIRVPSTGTDSHVIGQKQQDKICSPLRDAASSSVVQDVRAVEQTSTPDKPDQLPSLTTEKIQDKISVPKTNNTCKNDTASLKTKTITPEKICSTEVKPRVPELPSEIKKDTPCQQVKHKNTSSNSDKVKHKSSKTQSSVPVASTEAQRTIPEARQTTVSCLPHVPEAKFDHLTEIIPLSKIESKSEHSVSPSIQVKAVDHKLSSSDSVLKAVSQSCPVSRGECKKDVDAKSNGGPSVPVLSEKQASVVFSSQPKQPEPPTVPTVPVVPVVERVKPTQSHNDKSQHSSDISKTKPNPKCEQPSSKDNVSVVHGKDQKDEKPIKELKHTCNKGKEQSAKLCIKTESVVATKSENSDVKPKPFSKPNEVEAKHKHDEVGRHVSQSKHKQTDKKHCTEKDMHAQSSTVSSSVHHKSSSHVRSPETSNSKKHEDLRPCVPISDPDQMAVPRIGSDVPRIGSDVPPMMQQDAADAACSDYMRLLASGHGQPMMPPHFGAMDPLYALRFQEYPITPAALYPLQHSGLLPSDQMLYQNTGMMQSVTPPCFQPAIQMYQPRLPYAIPLQVTEPLKPFGCLPYPSTAVYPCSLNGLKRKQYDSEPGTDSPQKRLCLDYSQPQFKMDNWSQSYALGQGGSDAARAYTDEYSLRKYCEEKYMSSESTDAQVFSRWSELAAKTGYCRLCSCTNSRPNDIRFWSVEDVCRFLTRLDGCGIYAENFMEQRVDGRILPLLTTDHLIKNLGMKLGPAVLLTEAVAKKIQEAGKLLTCESCRGLLPGPVV